MVANRRNFLFRVSIVINIAVLLYAAMHLSGNTSPGGEWMPITADGSERGADIRYLSKEDFRNFTEGRIIDPSIRNFEESTSQKTPSTLPTTNKTASSTTSIAELEKKLLDTSSEADLMNETLDIVDENALSDTTLTRLRFILGCNDRNFLPQYIQRGEFWVLKNYVRADHGTVLCHETITYTTHAGFEFLDNVQPLVER
jgi:beta-1,4-glucuronyltransferase 1